MMKRDWLKLLGGVALAASLAGGTTVYANENGWNEWDSDSSGDISYDEWDTGFDDEGLYSDWDTDGDGALTEEEYGQGIFEGYDNNGDGVWDQEEYQMYQDDAGENGFWDV
jgi:hypothetical protein